MTPLRAAFCEMVSGPGPDSATYRAWAASFSPRDTANLVDYVTDTIKAIERVGTEERCWLPTLRALLAELRGGAVVDSDEAALLEVRRQRALTEIRAGEILAAIRAHGAVADRIADIIAGWE